MANIPEAPRIARVQNILHTNVVAATSLPKPCPVVYPINSTNIPRKDGFFFSSILFSSLIKWLRQYGYLLFYKKNIHEKGNEIRPVACFSV
jgi:hypothetical protein